MLFFDHLDILDKHISFLGKKIKTDGNLFLVGGCIRDLLLWTNSSPTDIDFTMAGTPVKIYKAIDKTGLSHFMTEKFGTITLIKKGKKKWDTEIKYELTPLRTEWDYEDFRHPGEITRSNDLLLDSQRRDFTVNCIYYTSVKHTAIAGDKSASKVHNDEELLYKLNKHGFLYLTDTNTFILQSPDLIGKLFAEGKFQKNELSYLVNQLTEHTVVSLKHEAWSLKLKWSSKKSPASSIKHQALRFILDPHQGIRDLAKRKLRAVGDADKRFTEDALRMIRGIRFVSVINEKLKGWNVKKLKGSHKEEPIVLFDFIKETWNSIKKNSALVSKVAKERIKDELVKSFTEGNPFGFISLLDEAKLLPILFPALAKTKNVEQPVRYHPFDVYAHTMLCLLELQRLSTNYLMRFAMLYHDVGKVDQFDAYEEGLSKEEIRDILAGPSNHRRSSVVYVHSDFSALGFGKKEVDEIARYVAHHHKLEEILFATRDKREKKLRKFLSEAGIERVRNIIDITMADRLGQFNPLQNSSDLEDLITLRKMVERLQKEEGQFTAKDLAVNGADVMKHFKLKAWPLVGDLLEKALNRVMDDLKTRNTPIMIRWYLKMQLPKESS